MSPAESSAVHTPARSLEVDTVATRHPERRRALAVSLAASAVGAVVRTSEHLDAVTRHKIYRGNAERFLGWLPGNR